MIWNERIKTLREAHDLTLKDIAKDLGVSEATAQRYESNAIKNIPYEVIVKYAEIFRCSPCYIMGWENDTELTLSDMEEKIIKKYRSSDELTRQMVQKLLDVDGIKDAEKKLKNNTLSA